MKLSSLKDIYFSYAQYKLKHLNLSYFIVYSANQIKQLPSKKHHGSSGTVGYLLFLQKSLKSPGV